MPTPFSGTEIGEFVALLVIVTLPVTLPIAAGIKVTFKVAVLPGVRTVPADTPLALKPPEMLTFEIVTLELPEFVIVTGRLELVPVLTFPKLRLAGLPLSR